MNHIPKLQAMPSNSQGLEAVLMSLRRKRREYSCENQEKDINPFLSTSQKRLKLELPTT